MDKRISYKIVLDCETAPCDRTIEEVEPLNMLAYDIGWVVTDKRGIVYEKRSFVVADIFLDEQDLMRSAYYANKIPEYWEGIKTREREVRSLYNIRKIFLNDIENYNITQIFAHNMRFDNGALNNTIRWVTKSKNRYFFPYDCEVCDTLKLSRQFIATMPTYKNYCENNGYLTKNGRPRLTAEIIYRFISGEEDFSEEHKGLEDCMIEKEILAYCYRKHKKMNPKLWE